MRAGVLLACALALGGCRSDEELTPPDLNSAVLYCPPAPPPDGQFVCDPTAIPYCTYPAQSMTCRCGPNADGVDVLTCGGEIGPDAGLPTGTGT